MVKIVKYTCAFIICVSTISCENNIQQKDGYTTVEVNVDSVGSLDYYNDVLESMNYIQLETNDKCRIGDIKQLIVNNGLIFVLSDCVYCFNMNGEYKYSISQHGRAKNEFMRIGTISIVYDRLFVHDDISQKVIVFDANTGDYVETMKMSDGFYKVYAVKDGYVTQNFGLGEDSLFYIFDADDIVNVKRSAIPSEGYPVVLGNSCCSGDGVVYSDIFRNSAVKITTDGARKILEVSLSKDKKLSDEDINDIIKKGDWHTSFADRLHYLTYVNESDKYIVGSLVYNNCAVHLVYNKTTKESYCFRAVRDNIWQMVPINDHTSDGSYFYSIVDATSIVAYRNYYGLGEEPVNSKWLPLYEKFASVSENSNPIVMQYSFKL